MMADDPNANPNPNPAPAVPDPSKAEPKDDPTKSVSYETHRRLLDEKKKLQADLDKIAADKAAAAAKEAEEKGEYQKLLEQERAESAKLKEKLAVNDAQEAGRRKLSAILNGAGGSIDRKWFKTLDVNGIIDAVIIDPTTGEVDTTSVVKAIETIKKSYPEIIVASEQRRLPNGNPAAGGGAPAGKIKYSDYRALPTSAEMNKWRPDQIIDD